MILVVGLLVLFACTLGHLESEADQARGARALDVVLLVACAAHTAYELHKRAHADDE